MSVLYPSKDFVVLYLGPFSTKRKVKVVVAKLKTTSFSTKLSEEVKKLGRSAECVACGAALDG